MTCAPLSLSRIVKRASNTVDLPNKIIVPVGMITNDIRLTDVPNLTIAALCFTCAAKSASSRPAATPTGANTVLLCGKQTALG
ncbi:hypothetical protein B0H14DRAFT_2349580 [Mycena olivaceomarginata]|nr:hypothetical protein B0H14DRAFT_2349580 [Mycena olivaceomarginata]